MGEEKWTRQEPGSISGSYVPPPVAKDDEPAAEQPTGKTSRRTTRTSGSPSSPSGLPRRTAGASQHRLQLAQPSSVTAAPQAPDNVRYLFRPILTQAVPEPELAEEPDETTADDGPHATGQPTTTVRLTTGQPTTGQPATGPATTGQPTSEGLEREQGEEQAAANQQVGPTGAGVGAGTHRRAPAVGATGAPLRGLTASARLRRHVTWVAAIFLVLITAAGTALALVRHSPATGNARAANPGTQGGQAPGAHGGAKVIAGLSKAGIIRSHAARWISHEVSRNVIVACDAVMCAQLFNDGLPASNLLVLSPSAPDPLGADIVVGTPALRSQFGSRLALVYAPSVLASFGAGKSRVDVRVVAAQGAANYEQQLSRDVTARQHDGSLLLRNNQVTVAPAGQPELIAGLVDDRLLAMLPVLATQHPVQILAFYDRPPGSDQGVPLSGVELSGTDAASGLAGSAYRHWLLSFLRSQRAPYLASSITTGRAHGHDVIFVRFARPSPIGLLNGV